MPVTFQSRTLDNGLTVIAEVDPDAHTAAQGFFVRTGARDEQPEVMGVSHFLEHMMFKGTERRSADDVNREFDEIGASYNAYTSSEMTAFFATTLPEHRDRALDILADILRPSLRTEDFDAEKGVILEEIAMYKDSPFWVLYEEAMQRHYADHPLGHRVLGTNETVGALSQPAMKSYFEQRYSADNTVIALAGAVDFDAACAQAQDLCGSWANTGATRDNAPPPIAGDSFERTDAKLTRAYLLMLAPAPAMSDDDRYAAMLLAKVLGDPGNSRLHWALVETGLAEEAQAAYDPNDGVGMYFAFASGEPGALDEIRSVMDRELADLIESITDDDLERLRNKLATAVTLAGERPAGRMQRLGRLWTYLGEHTPLEEELARIEAVTLDDLRRVYKRFPFEPRTVGVLKPA